MLGLPPFTLLARRFQTDQARALLAGAAAHSMRPLTAPLTGSFGLLFTLIAHTCGWPLVQGGSRRIVDALLAELDAAGAEVHTGRWIKSLDDLPRNRLTMLDVSPRQLLLSRVNKWVDASGAHCRDSRTDRVSSRSIGR